MCCDTLQMGGNPFGGPTMDPMAAFGFQTPNMNPQVGVCLFALDVSVYMLHLGAEFELQFD